MPDKTADLTVNAIKHVKGERNIEIFYSDRSGEIERALRDLHIASDNRQFGVPQNSAVVVERLVQRCVGRNQNDFGSCWTPAVLLGVCALALLYNLKRSAEKTVVWC